MLSPEEARARVAKGAAHLDAVRPGWFNRIDVGTLTLHDPCGCIVGQLTNRDDYFEFEKLFMTAKTVVEFGCELSIQEYGPVLESEVDDPRRQELFCTLQDAWIEAIADRRLAAAKPEIPAAVVA